jgi:predicted ABC-type ATPase
MAKEIYIVGGSNGAGKTTFAKEFIKIAGLTFLNADEDEYTIANEDFFALFKEGLVDVD